MSYLKDEIQAHSDEIWEQEKMPALNAVLYKLEFLAKKRNMSMY